MQDPSPDALLKAAAAGDRTAWDDLVDRYGRLVWAVARSFRLDDASAADVSQTTWLRLVEHADRIEKPERLGGWLATVARNEAIKLLRQRRRQVLTDYEIEPAENEAPELDAMLLESERSVTLMHAFRALSEACRQLLRLMTLEPALSYEEVAAVVGRPVGSLGPTRARCLNQLRGHLARAEAGHLNPPQGGDHA